MFLTYSVLIESKLFNGGKGDGLPPKSLILLSITTNQEKKTMMMNVSWGNRCWFCEWLTGRSSWLRLRYWKVSVHPNLNHATACKKKTCLVLHVFSWGVLMEKEVDSYSFIILVQLPMKSGIRPVKLLSLILLRSHK